ncbi:MAG TPA: PepSY-like domain-containing protein [Puia sp.]
MKINHALTLVIALFLAKSVVKAQATPIPAAVTKAFVSRFPAAQNAEWREKTMNFTVFFTVNDRKCEAKFEKNGGWLSTEESLAWDSLPGAVRDSFKLSKYADWKGTSAYSLRKAEAAIQYHLVVTKSDMGRRILFYSPEGKLEKD